MLTLTVFFIYDVVWMMYDIADVGEAITSHPLEIVADIAFCCVFTFTSLLLSIWTFRRLNIARSANLKRSLTYMSTTTLVGNLLLGFAMQTLIHLFYEDYADGDFLGSCLFFSMVASTVALLLSAQNYIRLIIKQNNEKFDLEKKYLKLQLDPHFVFNSLSTLAGMIKPEPDKAEEYVVRMSRIYRHMLRNLDQNLIPIDEALAFASDYVALLNLRFTGNVVFHAEQFGYRNDECILAMSLQLLIENAVKHNAPTPHDKLHISLRRDNGYLVISNNIIAAGHVASAPHPSSMGMGIENLRRRYWLECSTEPVVKADGNTFEVKIPIINRHHTPHE